MTLKKKMKKKWSDEFNSNLFATRFRAEICILPMKILAQLLGSDFQRRRVDFLCFTPFGVFVHFAAVTLIRYYDETGLSLPERTECLLGKKYVTGSKI